MLFLICRIRKSKGDNKAKVFLTRPFDGAKHVCVPILMNFFGFIFGLCIVLASGVGSEATGRWYRSCWSFLIGTILGVLFSIIVYAFQWFCKKK